jgi:hypothetical protein
MKPDQMLMNGDEPLKYLSLARQYRIHQAVSGKYSTNNNNSKDISVGRVGTRDMLDTSEKYLGFRRRVLEGQSYNASNLSHTLDVAWTVFNVECSFLLVSPILSSPSFNCKFFSRSTMGM